MRPRKCCLEDNNTLVVFAGQDKPAFPSTTQGGPNFGRNGHPADYRDRAMGQVGRAHSRSHERYSPRLARCVEVTHIAGNSVRNRVQPGRLCGSNGLLRATCDGGPGCGVGSRLQAAGFRLQPPARIPFYGNGHFGCCTRGLTCLYWPCNQRGRSEQYQVEKRRSEGPPARLLYSASSAKSTTRRNDGTNVVVRLPLR